MNSIFVSWLQIGTYPEATIVLRTTYARDGVYKVTIPTSAQTQSSARRHFLLVSLLPYQLSNIVPY